MKCSVVAPFGFTVTPPNGYNRAMIDSAPQGSPPLFPQFLTGGPQQFRLAPASAALLIGCAVLTQGGIAILHPQSQGAWLIRGEAATATTLGALLTAMLAARWLGRSVGVAVGLLQVTCLYSLGLADQPRPFDSFVTVLVTAAMGLFARANVPGRLAVDGRRRIQVFFCIAAALLFVSRAFGEFAGVLLICLTYVLLNQDGRAFRFLIHPLGLGVAAILAAGVLWLQHATTPYIVGNVIDPPVSEPAAAWQWPLTLAVGLLPWWPLSLVAVGVGCRRGDYAASFWRLAACWAIVPMVLAVAGLLDDGSVLAASCGPVSIFSAAGLWETVRWSRAKLHRRALISATRR